MTHLNIMRARALSTYAGHQWARSPYFTDELVQTANVGAFVKAAEIARSAGARAPRPWHADDLPQITPGGWIYGMSPAYPHRISWVITPNGNVQLSVYAAGNSYTPLLTAHVCSGNTITVYAHTEGDQADSEAAAQFELWLACIGDLKLQAIRDAIVAAVSA